MHCPHSDISFCPLYIAAHEAGGFSCDDGKLEDGCAVIRGLDYGKTLAALWRVKPDLVAEAAAMENEEMARQQRARNMKAAGLH